jgi:hypothetical protein
MQPIVAYSQSFSFQSRHLLAVLIFFSAGSPKKETFLQLDRHACMQTMNVRDPQLATVITAKTADGYEKEFRNRSFSAQCKEVFHSFATILYGS